LTKSSDLQLQQDISIRFSAYSSVVYDGQIGISLKIQKVVYKKTKKQTKKAKYAKLRSVSC